MGYQEDFVIQRNELFEHYRQGFEVVNAPKVFDKDYESSLRAGVNEFIQDHNYFKISSKERKVIENNNLFASDSVWQIERNWEDKGKDEVVKMAKARVEDNVSVA